MSGPSGVASQDSGVKAPASLVLLQPYVPEYRSALFDRVHSQLAHFGIRFSVLAGEGSHAQKARLDAVDEAEWLVTVRQKDVPVGKWTLQLRQVLGPLKQLRPEAVILEQAVSNLENYSALLYAKLCGVRVGFWGHGVTYTKGRSATREFLKAFVSRRGSWFFVYTDGGARELERKGFPPNQISVLRNSNDTSRLRRDLDRLSDELISDVCLNLGLTQGKTAIFLGRVDEDKGIDFLVKSAQLVAEQDPDFVLMVCGEGEASTRVRRLADAGGPIRCLGRVTGESKAIALASASFMTIPEWVGLAAVDSLAARVPIITCESDTHAPEFEYLRSGANCIVTRHNPDAYAQEILRLMASESERDRLAEQCRVDSDSLSVEEMADRFIDGVHAWFRSSGSA